MRFFKNICFHLIKRESHSETSKDNGIRYLLIESLMDSLFISTVFFSQYSCTIIRN